MRKKVLIVDDEQAVRDSISFCLLANNYNVMLAENGAAAVEAVERCASLGNDLAVILLDIEMPVMTGEEFLARASELGWQHRVILMSGSGSKLAQLQSPLIAGTLAKPFTEHGLLEKIGSIARGI